VRQFFFSLGPGAARIFFRFSFLGVPRGIFLTGNRKVEKFLSENSNLQAGKDVPAEVPFFLDCGDVGMWEEGRGKREEGRGKREGAKRGKLRAKRGEEGGKERGRGEGVKIVFFFHP
jgi:hypothetical protein